MNGFAEVYGYDCGIHGYMVMYIMTACEGHWDDRTTEKSWWIVPGTMEY